MCNPWIRSCSMPAIAFRFASLELLLQFSWPLTGSDGPYQTLIHGVANLVLTDEQLRSKLLAQTAGFQRLAGNGLRSVNGKSSLM